MEARSVTAADLTMRWEEDGDGMPLVLIHGIPTTPRLWRHVVPQIKGARCLAWEMVGYGASIPEAQEREIGVAKQADYLLTWMDELGIERAVLGGHDLGGGVAQILAVRHPERCAGLFLTNAIGYDSWPIPSVKLMRAMGGMVRRLPNTVFEHVYATFIRAAHDNRERADESIHEHWPFYAEHGGAAALIRQVDSLNVQDTLAVADQLPKLNMPARLAWGAADPFQKIRYGERFAQDLDAPLRRIEGGKHFTPEDHPEVVAEELNDLIATASR